MTDAATWRADLERVLGWTTADERFVERIGARLDDDRRALLKAVVETRGDVRALGQRIAPGVLERIRARIPQAAAERTGRAWELLDTPLSTAWSPPANLSADEIAQRFLERYGARLEELTGHATKAAAAAKAASETLRGIASSKALVEAAAGLESRLDELKAAGAACAHPEGASLTDRAGSLTHEAIDSVEAARALRTAAQNLHQRCATIAASVQAWCDAPPADRAATAGSLATHLRAAATVVEDMRDQIARLAQR